ncbi:hypothetical protein [Kingella kingae]|nr:hypothetical protein [Kingella kingae]
MAGSGGSGASATISGSLKATTQIFLLVQVRYKIRFTPEQGDGAKTSSAE